MSGSGGPVRRSCHHARNRNGAPLLLTGSKGHNSRRAPGRGFTLIEVLVVVAIIALLVSILLPSLARAREQARRTLCSSNLHQIGVALLTYRESQKAFPHQARVGVPNSDITAAGGNVIGAWPTSVHAALGRYIGRRSSVKPNEVFYCPAVRESDRGLVDIDREQPAGSVGNPEPYLHLTYFYYGRLNAGDNDPAKPRTSLGEKTAADVQAKRKLYVTTEPDARRVLMADAVSLWTGGTQWRVNHGPDYSRYVEGNIPLLKGQNVGYGDGHVTWNPVYKFPASLRTTGAFSKLPQTAQMLQGQDLHWW